ncbi:MHS family MFS transporter [Ochrobactrum sp. Q0168]|uniref:MFS transporter n=1 Tax=Ochrobactrum sp. Q0168 TaxID=2793241 RepID=UPI0018EAE5AC|nr:MHS family MFS transporter [Ochrobactrum sp. Q0168]
MTTAKNSSLRVALASFIGTTIEYYDFFIFGTAAALVFPKIFFPESTPLMGTLMAFATLGVGFIARPIGGVVFGHFGDRIGRKRMLILSLIGMGVATCLMGTLPTYAQIGIWAPVSLAILRLVQGFCVGGEWGGATLMAVEHAPPAKRGFYGSFPQMGGPAGTATATLAFLAVSTFTTDDQLLTWGWRVPFLLSSLLVVVGLVIRFTTTESPEFERVTAKRGEVKLPVAVALSQHWREILIVAGIYLSQGVISYIVMSYLVSYSTTVAGIDRNWALLGVFIGAIVLTALCPVFGALSDRIGRKTTYMLGAVAMCITSGPAIYLIDLGQPWALMLAILLVYGLAMAPACAVTGSLLSLAFKTEIRYTGVSIGYTLSLIVGSAFAPMIATAIYAKTGTIYGLYVYLLIVSAISIVSVLLLPGPFRRKEAKNQTLRYTDEKEASNSYTNTPFDEKLA